MSSPKKTTFNFPFVKLILSNAPRSQVSFFKKQFFAMAEDKTTTAKFTINISFSKQLLPTDLQTLENKVGFDGKFFYCFDTKNNSASLDWNSLSKSSINLTVDPDFDTYYLYHFLIEPMIVIWAAAHDISFCHASGLDSPKMGGQLFPAWRNTGKTNTVLSALDGGWSFLGDDFCIVKDNQLFTYPKKLNLFSYNFVEYPNLLEELPFFTKNRLKITIWLKKALLQASQKLAGPFSKVIFRLSELAEVSTNLKVSPVEIGIPIQTSAELKGVFLLQRVNKITEKQSPLSQKEFVSKMSRIIEYELQPFINFYNQFKYFSGQENKVVESFLENYRQGLKNNISAPIKIVEITPKTSIDNIIST
jgi:hypothetical protein